MNMLVLAALIGERNTITLENTRARLQAALPQDAQLFISEHWRDLHLWIGTPEGQIAIQTFVNDWRTNCKL